jgi:hypothetical protein
MVVNSKPDSRCAVIFLVINQIPDLPAFAINSVLRHSDSHIYIGTVREIDRETLPKSNRISFIDLNQDAIALGIATDKGQYESFEKDDFFSLVQLKWALLRRVSHVSKCEFLIYNDIDVFWLRPLLPDLIAAFENSNRMEMMIQHFSWVPGQPQLCMGFVSFRTGTYFDQLIANASDLHAQMLRENPRTGDDDVITELYRSNGFPAEIQLLPQTTYPVGNLLNLFSKHDEFPGLQPFEPYIFHANFVVGLRKKLLVTRIFFKLLDLRLDPITWRRRLFMDVQILAHRLVFNAKQFLKFILRKFGN